MSANDHYDPEHTLVTGQTASGRKRELELGDIVGGNYKIKAVIGRGGMGVVFWAEHLGMHSDRALKALAPDRVDADNWERFQTEGKAIARLDHPNIVKVFDMGTDGPGCLYYTMELLRGHSLAEVVHGRGILETEEALDIFSQICAGLGHAHKLGLVHRDVKPSNVILVEAGPGLSRRLVKIIDFGLVKLMGDENQNIQSQTATGLICGSPHYMSPEQCMGGKIDNRSDIYSLGCALFECLTGAPPFCGQNGLETAMMHQNQMPRRLGDRRPDKNYPENLEQVIGRMLEKTPARRYQSMEEVSQDLDRVKQGKSLGRIPVQTGAVEFERDLGSGKYSQDQDMLSQASRERGQSGEKSSRQQDKVSRSKNQSVAIVASWLGVGLLVVLAGWASYNYVNLQKKKSIPTVYAETLVHPSAPVATVVHKLTADELHARDVFDKWPAISQGTVITNGVKLRMFAFPDVSVGFICWSDKGNHQVLARGKIAVPANQDLTLRLPRPEGVYARQFPKILSKIGPDDIVTLAVVEPAQELDDESQVTSISADLLRSVKGWKSLRNLDFYHATVPRETLIGLNQLHSMDLLGLRDSAVDGNDLAEVKWLNQLKVLDVKGISHVDAVLGRLAGSTKLEKLWIDRSAPSDAALEGLARCPHLFNLSLAECKIDNDSLVLIANIPNLEQLSISRCHISPKAYDLLAKLKKLKLIDAGPIAPLSLYRLKAVLPHCIIKSVEADPSTGL